MDNYRGMLEVRGSCEAKAEDDARFGAPQWPSLAFSHFVKGADAPTTGVITITEPTASFQNQFGAYQRAQVICDYDLAAKKVKTLAVLPK